MKKETRYVTEDGQAFRDPSDALEHEISVATANFLIQKINSNDDDLLRELTAIITDHRGDLKSLLQHFDDLTKIADELTATTPAIESAPQKPVSEATVQPKQRKKRKPVTEETKARMRQAALNRAAKKRLEHAPDGGHSAAEGAARSAEEASVGRIAAGTFDPKYARDMMDYASSERGRH